uniref:HTH psq-type domain-containing protein n=1 Tax=Chrysemys picta bellii TaxID=8478 RepID=A0A8C3HMJ6_CHRPI
MAPKLKPTTSSDIQPKKQRSVPTLEEKLAVLNLLRDGTSVSNVARKYGRNESSIRAIKIREREINQAVASSAPITAKVTSQVLETNMKWAFRCLLFLQLVQQSFKNEKGIRLF